MKPKLLLKVIFKDLFKLFKCLLVISVAGALVAMVCCMEFIRVAIFVILSIITLCGIIAVIYEGIEDKYKKELTKQKLKDREFEVSYTVTYKGVKTVKAKDKRLISFRNFDERTDDEFGQIKIIKVKEIG